MIPLFKVAVSDKIDRPLLDVIHSGWLGQGEKVAEFERLLSERFDNPNCLTLSAGTHGLSLALKLLDIGPGDEVITTPLTCTATNMPILNAGADIVWADVKDDFNINPNSIISSITEKTKAVIVVHWGGYPVNLGTIYRAVKERNPNIAIIEDAAHCWNSIYNNTLIGSCKYSDFTMMSFQAIKHLTAGDGGVLFTKSDEDYRRGKLLRWYGIDRETPRTDFRCEEDIKEHGDKWHMNDINAVIGINNMKLADKNVTKTRENACFYDKELSGMDGITITQPFHSNDRLSSYWLYTIQVEDRSEFCHAMGVKGISVSRVHERNDIHTCFKKYRKDLPGLNYIINKYISIPVGWWVTKENREYIIQSIKEGW